MPSCDPATRVFVLNTELCAVRDRRGAHIVALPREFRAIRIRVGSRRKLSRPAENYHVSAFVSFVKNIASVIIRTKAQDDRRGKESERDGLAAFAIAVLRSALSHGRYRRRRRPCS